MRLTSSTASETVPAAPGQLLVEARFRELAAVPAKGEWFANIDNRLTLSAYEGDLQDFMKFVGLTRPEDSRAFKVSY